jgi:RND family efflux transporter MFP subunit
VQKLHKEGAVSQEQVEGAKTQYEAAKQQLGQAKTLISITSPFSGVVLEVFQKAGSKIGAETPIVKVANLKKIKVQMHVSDQVINLYKAGQPTFLIMDGDTVWGKIERTALSANEMNHAYRVNAIFGNSDGDMKSGMFRNVYTIVNQKDEVLKVPFEIVIFEGEKSFIYVSEGDKAVKREVVLGIRNGTEYEVVEGLTAEDKIILTGITMISDGSKINVISE